MTHTGVPLYGDHGPRKKSDSQSTASPPEQSPAAGGHPCRGRGGHFLSACIRRAAAVLLPGCAAILDAAPAGARPSGPSGRPPREPSAARRPRGRPHRPSLNSTPLARDRALNYINGQITRGRQPEGLRQTAGENPLLTVRHPSSKYPTPSFCSSFGKFLSRRARLRPRCGVSPCILRERTPPGPLACTGSLGTGEAMIFLHIDCGGKTRFRRFCPL